MAEHLTHYPKVEGLSRATVAGQRERDRERERERETDRQREREREREIVEKMFYKI